MHAIYLSTIPILWTAFGLSLLLSRNRQKPSIRREGFPSWLGYNVPIFLTFLLIAIPGWPGGLLGRRFLPWHPVNFWLGALLVLAGLGLATWARRALRENWSVTVEVKEAHELVRSGPYRWVRHPIYTGLLLAFAGSALTIGQWRGIAGLLIVCLTLWLKSRAEERYMTETFGERYRQYAREVPALVPSIRRA